jgi:hypothetical protein
MSYFIVVTLINLAMGVLGLWLEGEKSFGYEAFFFPLLYGVLGMIPSLLFYSKKELFMKEIIIRKCLELICLEAIILSFLYFNGVTNMVIIVSVGTSILIISVLVQLFLWYLNQEEARRMEQLLRQYQLKKE